MSARALHVDNGLTAEQKLMVACARGESDRSAIRELAARIGDWDTLAAMAVWHGLTPRLHAMLAENAQEFVPQIHLEQMERTQRAATGHGTFLAAEMIRIVKLLEKHGIGVMPFKAGGLAAILYDSVGQRPLLDVDLFVRRGDALRARETLIEDGYTCTDPLDGGTADRFVRDECEFHFEHPRHRTLLELHWDVLPRYAAFRLDLDGIRDRAQERSICGTTMRVPTPEDLIVVLSVHGSKHRWDRLKWLRDLRQVVEVHRELNWGMMVERARRAGALRVVLVGLRLGQMLAGLRLPDDVGRTVEREGGVQRLAMRLRGEILAWPPVVRSTAVDVRLQLRLRERWLDRLSYAMLVVGGRQRAAGVR